MPAIDVKNLSKSFGTNRVLNDFSLTLRKGENLAVLGRSGSGKSVLIKCIIGLIESDSGSIQVLGQEITSLTSDQLDTLRTRIGFLFQSNALYDSMTVRENLEFSLRRHWTSAMRKGDSENAVLEALTDVGLAHTIDMMPAELSGGMKKRVALARTLILKPEIILYDEPTTGLDPITSREISQLILNVQRKYNTASIIISHDMSCIKLTSNRVLMLIDGKCYSNDTFERLRTTEDEAIKQFFD